jgi:hypothetical protein
MPDAAIAVMPAHSSPRALPLDKAPPAEAKNGHETQEA